MESQKSLVKPFLIGISFAFAGLWYLSSNNGGSFDEFSYTKEDCDQDLCMIYTQLGLSSEVRKDFAAAIDSYKKALAHKPDQRLARKRLFACLQKANLSNMSGLPKALKQG